MFVFVFVRVCVCVWQPRRWPSYGQNRESVGELWLGLLRFYTEHFDFKEHVICVRQKDTLSPFQKQWTSKYITIEGSNSLELVDFPKYIII